MGGSHEGGVVHAMGGSCDGVCIRRVRHTMAVSHTMSESYDGGDSYLLPGRRLKTTLALCRAP